MIGTHDGTIFNKNIEELGIKDTCKLQVRTGHLRSFYQARKTYATQELAKFTRITYIQAQCFGSECSICQMPLRNVINQGIVQMVVCDHIYHPICVAKWFETKNAMQNTCRFPNHALAFIPNCINCNVVRDAVHLSQDGQETIECTDRVWVVERFCTAFYNWILNIFVCSSVHGI